MMHAFLKSDKNGDGELDLVQFRDFLHRSKLVMKSDSSTYSKLTAKLYVLTDTLSDKELDFTKKSLAARNITAGLGSSKGRRRSIIGKMEPSKKGQTAQTVTGVTLLGASQLYTLGTESHTLTDPEMNKLITDMKLMRLTDTDNSKKKALQKAAMEVVIEQNIRHTQSFNPTYTRFELDLVRQQRSDHILEEKDATFHNAHPFTPEVHNPPQYANRAELSESNDVGHYRKRDIRTSVERTLDECTFHPETKESPFVSNRTLGRTSSVRGHWSKFWTEDESTTKAAKKRAPVKVPLYFINPERPPDYIDKHVVALESSMYRCVAYLEEFTAPAERGAFGGAVLHDEPVLVPVLEGPMEEDVPTAPAVPEWADMESPSPQKVKIVINKGGDKKKGLEKKSAGPSWEDIMKEMKARSNLGGLKKAPVVEKKAPGKLSKKKKKKGGAPKFDNVIDELSHTLRRLKGDVSDSDDECSDEEDEDVSSKPPPPPAPASDQAPAPPTDKYKKYRIMARNKLPEGAIRQRMTLDNVEDEDMDAFFTGDWQSGVAPVVTEAALPPPPPPTAAIAENEGGGDDDDDGSASDFNPHKYVVMQKCGLPEGAIRQRMMLDGVDPEDVDAFLSGKVRGDSSGGGGSKGKGKGKDDAPAADADLFAGVATPNKAGPTVVKPPKKVDPPALPPLSKRIVVRKLPADFSSCDDNFGFTAPLDRSGGIVVPMGIYVWASNRGVPPGEAQLAGYMFSKSHVLKEKDFVEYTVGVQMLLDAQVAAEAEVTNAADEMENSKRSLNLSDLHLTTETSMGPGGKLRPEDMPGIRNLDKFLERSKQAHRAREARDYLEEAKSFRIGPNPTSTTYTGKVTKPVEFRSHFGDRSAHKTHTFRKVGGDPSNDREEYEIFPFAQLQAHGEKVTSQTPSQAKWMCSLREESFESFGKDLGGAGSVSSTGGSYDYNRAPTQGSSPILRSDKFSRVGESKRRTEELESNRAAFEREQKRKQKDALKMQAMKAAADADSYRRTTTKDYSQRVADSFGGNAHGLSVKKAASKAYAQYMSKRSASGVRK